MPGVKCVMLSTFDNPTYVARAVAAGAHDYVLKGCSRAELIHSITAAAAGEAPARLGELRRVATTMALGLSNKEIAQSLTISVETVKEHVQNVLRKLAVSDRTQAAVWAVRRGIV